MISTEIFYGQGFGNQLACYVTTRALAETKGLDFGIHDPNGCLGDKRYNTNGLYFMNIDLGKKVDKNKIKYFYNEKQYRYFTNTCYHDMHEGCWVNITDDGLLNISDDTHIVGIMQGPDYFYHKINEVKKWLEVKREYDIKDYSSDDICVLNIRANLDSSVYLPKSYWLNAMNHMLKINPGMRFIVITEDVNTTRQLLPELYDNIFDFGIGEDYSIIKNAKYLIVSNSSFSIFPSLTSDTVKFIIAPKYMARYSYSDGYWSQGYNIYPTYTYMDRDGYLFTADECINEFKLYDVNNKFYSEKVVEMHKPFPNVATIRP